MSEISVPQEQQQTGEIGVPDIEAQQFASQMPVQEQRDEFERQEIVGPGTELFEETDPVEIGGEEIPADPFGPIEQGGTPDRFIREDRDAFVFPGSQAIETEAATTTQRSAVEEAQDFGVGEGFGAQDDILGPGLFDEPLDGGLGDTTPGVEPFEAGDILGIGQPVDAGVGDVLGQAQPLEMAQEAGFESAAPEFASPVAEPLAEPTAMPTEPAFAEPTLTQTEAQAAQQTAPAPAGPRLPRLPFDDSDGRAGDDLLGGGIEDAVLEFEVPELSDIDQDLAGDPNGF